MHRLFQRSRWIFLFLITLAFVVTSYAANQHTWIPWKQCLSQKADWYGSSEAIRIAGQVLLYQHDIGGWPKNIDMAEPLTAKQKQGLIQNKSNKSECTIDNGSTYRQIIFLAKVFSKTNQKQYKAAFDKGLAFLFQSQYENGGWPQFPYKKGYYSHITFNDDAMIGVMSLLQDIVQGKAPYEFVESSLQKKAQKAIDKGIDCILKCQVVVNGKKTGWCAQHDEYTLKPAPARSYEKISLSGSEGAKIVQFLMSIDHPSPAIIDSIQSAVAWMKAVKLTGIKIILKPVSGQQGKFDRVVVSDPNATPLWARFYEIGTNRPIFCGRDGIIKYSLAEIEYERRNGYSWYTNRPEEILEKDYPAWSKKWLNK